MSAVRSRPCAWRHSTTVTRQAVSKHLTALEHAGLVRSERSGRERLWRLQPARLAAAGSALERASARWDAAIERLRGFVKTPRRP